MFVLSLESGNTMKYSLSPWKIPWALPSRFPSGSGYIWSYIPPLVTIQMQCLYISILQYSPGFLLTRIRRGAHSALHNGGLSYCHTVNTAVWHFQIFEPESRLLVANMSRVRPRFLLSGLHSSQALTLQVMYSIVSLVINVRHTHPYPKVLGFAHHPSTKILCNWITKKIM